MVTVTSPDGLNLRAAPNTSAQVLAAIPFGSILGLTGDPTPDQWYPVSFGSLNGWAYGAYLTEGQVNPNDLASLAANGATGSAGSASSAAVGQPQANNRGGAGSTPFTFSPNSTPSTMTVNTDALNLRAAPDPNAKVVTSVPKGTRVQVTGAPSGSWLPVQLSGLNGWMDSAYLTTGPVASLSSGIGNVPFGPVNLSAPLNAAMFDGAALGKPAGPETGLEVAAPPPSAQGKFVWPVNARRITTTFKSIHQAVDIDQFPAGGNPAVAIADGIVTYAGGDECCSYGLYVIVQHRDGYSSLYAHLSKIEVTQGQLVHQNQELGLTGNTGNSTGPHIHFAIYLNGDPLDPLSVLPAGADIWPGA